MEALRFDALFLRSGPCEISKLCMDFSDGKRSLHLLQYDDKCADIPVSKWITAIAVRANMTDIPT